MEKLRWRHMMPLWTGRPDADGFIAHIDIPTWWWITLWALFVLNATVWGCLGLYFAVRVFV